MYICLLTRFPASSPSASYHCCADGYNTFRFMNQEGSLPSIKSHYIADINQPFTESIHDELMMSYCGAVTFTDRLLGDLLDVIDELRLWDNITLVLTADHGMHNAEKVRLIIYICYDL